MRTFAIACAALALALALALFVAGAVAVWDGEWGAVRHAHGSELVNDIERAEGFRGSEYADPRGFPTIAYGIKLPLTKTEGELLLVHRLEIETRCIAERWPPWRAASRAVQDALRHAGFVLGCTGLLEFTKALHALALSDYGAARAEFRRSDWYRQDPRRVEAVIARLPK